MQSRLRILQINTSDSGGGAAKIAYNIHCTYRTRGYLAQLIVGNKCTDDPDVVLIANETRRNLWARFWATTSNHFFNTDDRNHIARRLKWFVYWLGQPKRILEIKRGYEDFNFPGTWCILDLLAKRPDIIHCHNLHGSYFDLRALPWLSQQAPVILTMHDAWLLSGHCAHSLDCERWKKGCGECPDLSLAHAIKRDASQFNWHRKKSIYSHSKFYVTTPSQWLMDKVQQSMLMDGAVGYRVIHNGTDINVFYPGSKQEARKELNIPNNAKVMLFAGNGVTRNIWRDYKTMHDAFVGLAGQTNGKKLLFIAVGEDAPKEVIENAEIHFVAQQKDQGSMAKYYQAADIFVHAARADTFPNTVLEAMGCGVPVVATAVGGIPEQIVDGITGFLVPEGNAEAMSVKIKQLLDNDDMRSKMGTQAAAVASSRFSLDRQADDFLDWYQEIIDNHHKISKKTDISTILTRQ